MKYKLDNFLIFIINVNYNVIIISHILVFMQVFLHI